MSKPSRRASARRMAGMTLIELMISMVLGLVVIGGATSVILANRQSYRTNEGLSQMQESARTAFELLARDIRQAGVTGCNNNGKIANVVQTDSGTEWWQTWFALRGFGGSQTDGATTFGTARGQRIAGTDSIQLQGGEGVGLTIVQHQPTSAMFRINTSTTSINDNDIIMVCDFDHAAIMAVTQYNSANTTVVHNRNVSGSPRNCSHGLGYPTDCSSVGGNSYEFGPNSQLMRMAAVDWYIGSNARAGEGGRSLFRRRMGVANPEEVVAGVSNLALSYREAGRDDFRVAGSVSNWNNVNAVQITLTVQSSDRRVSTNTTNEGRLDREFTNVVTLRNRVP